MSSTLLDDPRRRSSARRSASRRRVSRADVTRWLVRCSWGYLATAVMACLALWMLADRWWPATIFLFGPRWLLLLPLAVLVPVAVAFRRSILMPLVVAAAIVLVPVMGLRFGWRAWLGSTNRERAVRIVTLNTGGSEALGLELPFRVRDWNADIVALQECGSVLASAVREMSGWHHHVAGQLCLLSRHPIGRARSITWDDLAGAREQGLGGSSHAAEYSIETPDGALRVVNLHLETARKGLEGVFELDFDRIGANATLRAAESRRIRDWLGAAESTLVIVGDFNMPVESAIYRRDWSDFRNAFSEAGTGFGATRDNGWIQVRIDHVLTGDAWRPTRAVVGPVVGLDHRPVIVDLGTTGAPTTAAHAQPRTKSRAPHRSIERERAPAPR